MVSRAAFRSQFETMSPLPHFISGETEVQRVECHRPGKRTSLGLQLLPGLPPLLITSHPPGDRHSLPVAAPEAKGRF